MTLTNEQWKSAVLTNTHSIEDAINNLNLTSLKIVLIVDTNYKFIGTVSDGDIRRALLAGKLLKTQIEEIVNTKPVKVLDNVSLNEINSIMRLKKLLQIPIVTIANRLVGLHIWEDLEKINKIDNVFVVMLGGKGTRLRPHTENCPKPLLHVGGKPILAHILEKARSEGFSNFIFSINYLGNMIRDYFGNGDNFDVSIEYIEESKPLSTAGSLYMIQNRLKLPFVITNGDVIADLKYTHMIDYHILNESDATMAVKRHDLQNPFGVVMTEGLNIKGFEEKPIYTSYVNAGIYVLNPDILNFLEPNIKCTMPELFEKARKKSRRTIAYPIHEQWLDVGRPEDLF